MSKSVIIIGASGHGKVVADIVVKNGDQVVGFLDDNPRLTNKYLDFPVLGEVSKYSSFTKVYFVIAIGNARVREEISEKLGNVAWYTAIHPDAVISAIDVSIGEGTVIMANAVINSGAKIGRHCIINTGAIVEHDDQIADYVHISVGAKLAGTVVIGKSSWIGIGACVSNNIEICGNCTIGAGAAVVKNIDKPGTYVGVPAERMEKMNKTICDEKIRGVQNIIKCVPFVTRRYAA